MSEVYKRGQEARDAYHRGEEPTREQVQSLLMEVDRLRMLSNLLNREVAIEFAEGWMDTHNW